jgi:hypothetical protein
VFSFPSFDPLMLGHLRKPRGGIKHNKLELTASVAQHDVLAQEFDARETTMQKLSDNAATVWWQRKGATSSIGPMVGLLRLQSLHQHHYCYAQLFDYIAGGANAMADACSRIGN